MPRAHRYFLPNHVWHITHRCHKKEFLLKFARDRHRWRYWLFEARKRYGLCVLNYIVTSNHIHLLVFDQGKGEIAKSIQLIAGRTAQEYNQRKQRKGAFWEDRYHATAIDTTGYLSHCIVYIDLNMVRAGVVKEPSEWAWSGYHEMLFPRPRYNVINRHALLELLGIPSLEKFRQCRQAWVKESLDRIPHHRDLMWTQSLAVGRKEFVEQVQTALGIGACHRGIVESGDAYTLREPEQAYCVDLSAEMPCLSNENIYYWDG
jgi:putative transposase